MKKIIPVLIAFIILSSTSITCLASTIENADASASSGIYATYIEQLEGIYKADISAGKAEIILPDGTVITITGIPDNAIRLVILPVTKDDADAWAWFESGMKDYGTNIYPFDIYFEDENGNRLAVSAELTIMVTTPDAYKNPIICYLSKEGKAEVLKSSAEGKTVTFVTNHNSYYVVAEKVDRTNTVKPTAPNNSGTNSDKNNPKTGDSSNVALWFAILLSSCGFLIIVLYLKQENKDMPLS